MTNQIGIDRVKFSIKNLKFSGSNNNIIEMVRGDRVSVIDIATGEVVKIASFKLEVYGIALSNKDDYRISLKLNEHNDNFTLDVNIPKLLYNTNERNAHNKEHLLQVNQIIEKKLSEQGVYVDMRNAKLSSVEINYNSIEYKLLDALKLLRKGMQKVDEDNIKDNKLFVVENKNNIESLMLNKEYAKVKVYNKVKHLQDTEQLFENDNLIRIEVSTNNNGALKTISSDMTFNGLIENWDKLEKWYRNVITNYIKNTTEKFINEVVEEMTQQLLQGQKTYDVLINQATKGNLIDIELFSMAMKKYYKLSGKTKPHSVINNTKKRLQKNDMKLYVTITDNIKTIEKLFDELGV